MLFHIMPNNRAGPYNSVCKTFFSICYVKTEFLKDFFFQIEGEKNGQVEYFPKKPIRFAA